MKASLHTLHQQDSDWLRELEFCKEEIAILTKRLEEVISKNSGKETAAKVEHFQNKFILMRETVDTLHHDIGVREGQVEKMSEDRPNQIDESYSVVNDRVHNRMKDLSASLAETRYEFNKFLAKTL
jgi:hypothetical protein